MSMSDERRIICPDCDADEGVSRREFVRRASGVVLAGSLFPLATTAAPRRAVAAPTPSNAAETAVKRFYDALSADQRKEICFPFDHPFRSRINANWAITKATIDEYTKEQQAILDEIFRGVLSPDGYDRFQKQMEGDYGGFSQYHVAVFGTPGSGQFEWELTGRHVTLRADGDSAENVAFGGPIVYGHGEGDSKKGLPGNVYYYQTKKANEVFSALNGSQREKALLPKAPNESAVQLQGSSGTFPGIAVGELSRDQKELVEAVMKVILAPYREDDVNEAIAILKEGGGMDGLHMAFYSSLDIGDDKEWDIWRLEGPTFVWHFRGAPHVHAYINIGKKS
jgi:hypothetical protein